MLKRRRLPSGVRLGPPFPIRLFNTLGPLVRALGLWPRVALQTIPRDQITHVAYDELVADPVGKALAIYDRFGYPADPALKARMTAWLESHPSDKHGKHSYQLGDFGLTVEDVRRRMQSGEPRVAVGAG